MRAQLTPICSKYQWEWLISVWCQSQMPNPLSPVFSRSFIYLFIFIQTGGIKKKKKSNMTSGAFRGACFFPQGEGSRFSIFHLNDFANIHFWSCDCTRFNLVCTCRSVEGETCVQRHKEGSVRAHCGSDSNVNKTSLFLSNWLCKHWASVGTSARWQK